MEKKIETVRSVIIKLREKDLYAAISMYLKSNGIIEEGNIQILFKKEAFSEQKDGLNAYDEDIANVCIINTKRE